MSIRFEESGLNFGPFETEKVFRVEISKIYKRIQNGVVMAEFSLLKSTGGGEELWLVEAKSSVPKDLDSYMQNIKEKLSNALFLTLGAVFGRHSDAEAELPQGFKSLNFNLIPIKFVLVVGPVPDEHLVGVQNAFAKEMAAIVKTFGVRGSAAVVINEGKARALGLVS